ncbi:MAG: SgcJ/EcaC family oxidoreductase [Thermoguttaceae bacterium]
MRNSISVLAFVAVAFVAAWATLGQGRPSRISPEDEKAIRQNVDAFVKDYNDHNARAIATLFTQDGVTADDEGNSARGREAIEQVFANVFKEHPKTRMTNVIESIRMTGPAEAVENGTSTAVHDDGATPEKTRYRVVHVKQGGKWLMAAATELPEGKWGGAEALNQLEWLIGDWVDESPDALVLNSYHWTDNHRFILGQFIVQIGGKPAMTGSQRIGWDPRDKTIRSWVFDSEGGFAEGVWTREGDTWLAKLAGVTRDGKRASGTRKMTMVSRDRFIVQSVDRTVGDEKRPDGDKIIIVRRPPEPK